MLTVNWHPQTSPSSQTDEPNPIRKPGIFTRFHKVVRPIVIIPEHIPKGLNV